MNDLNINTIPCDVIQDIIPLYHDNVCSDKSRKYVDEHIKTCKECSSYLKALDDSIMDKSINSEARDVLAHHAKYERTLAAKFGMAIAGLLMLPIIIMFIVTMAGGATIQTTLVVIASMLLTAGLTVVPLMSKTKKLSRTIIFSTGALLLVILFAQMFFYQNGVLYFLETAFSVIFGLSVVFFPFVVWQADLPEMFADKKGLITFAWDTIWYYMMLLSFAMSFTKSASDILIVGTYGIIIPWVIFLIARYLPASGLTKAGAIMVAIDAWLFIGDAVGYTSIEISNDPGFVSKIIYISLAAVGVILGVIGLFVKKKEVKV